MKINFKNKRKFKKSDVSILASVVESNVGKNSIIKPFAHVERCDIGKYSSLGTFSAVFDAEVGNFVSIARDVYIGGASHPLDHVSTSGFFYIKPTKKIDAIYTCKYNWHSKKTIIGADTWIGSKAIILSGRNIGVGSVEGAGSVVTKDIPPYEVWGGIQQDLLRKDLMMS
jgi:acetyltransferase-like isoleucine patch superfamily enzyme